MKETCIAWLIVIFALGLTLVSCSAGETVPATATIAEPTTVPEPTAVQEATAVPEEPTPIMEPVEEQEEETMIFALTSAVFEPEEPIPAIYSCDGEDRSLPLTWGSPPEGTASLALIMDDPDAPMGTWVHWILYNIPAEAQGLDEAIVPEAELPDGSLHGKNSWSRLGYGGPCPPDGMHRYFFKLYALDTILELDSGATKEALLQATEGHVLAELELMGTYTR